MWQPVLQRLHKTALLNLQHRHTVMRQQARVEYPSFVSTSNFGFCGRDDADRNVCVLALFCQNTVFYSYEFRIEKSSNYRHLHYVSTAVEAEHSDIIRSLTRTYDCRVE